MLFDCRGKNHCCVILVWVFTNTRIRKPPDNIKKTICRIRICAQLCECTFMQHWKKINDWLPNCKQENLIQCCFEVCDAGRTLKRHWIDSSCLLGRMFKMCNVHVNKCTRIFKRLSVKSPHHPQEVLLASFSWYVHDRWSPSKHHTFTQCWFYVGPALQTVVQQKTSIRKIRCICRAEPPFHSFHLPSWKILCMCKINK